MVVVAPRRPGGGPGVDGAVGWGFTPPSTGGTGAEVGWWGETPPYGSLRAPWEFSVRDKVEELLPTQQGGALPFCLLHLGGARIFARAEIVKVISY